MPIRPLPRTALLSLVLVTPPVACDSGDDNKADKAAQADKKKADSKKADDGKAKDVKAGDAKADDAKADDAKADDAKGDDAKADDAKPDDPTAPVITDGELSLETETVGEIHLGLGPSDLDKVLGKPDSKGPIEEEGATGDFVQTWSYASKGLSITMAASDAKGSDQTVSGIDVDKTYTGELPWGLKIGSPRADVDKIYGEHFDEDFTDDNQFVAGSVYGGSHYRFKDGKVDSLFIGAGAE